MLISDPPITYYASGVLDKYFKEISDASFINRAYIINLTAMYNYVHILLKSTQNNITDHYVYKLFQVIMEIYVSSYLHIDNYDRVDNSIYLDDVREQIINELEMLPDATVSVINNPNRDTIISAISSAIAICEKCRIAPPLQHNIIRVPLLWSKSSSQVLLHMSDILVSDDTPPDPPYRY